LNTRQNEKKGMFDPSTLKKITIAGKSFLVAPLIFEPLQRAEAAFFKATGKHILINNAYRSTAEQAALYKKLKAANPAAIVAPPGYSFHEKGQAIDVSNYTEAGPYLRQQGFLNPLEKDKVHFSIGEFKAAKIAGAAALLLVAGIAFLFFSTITKKGL
jgi:hypothetical protein